MPATPRLDADWIALQKRKIEAAIVPKMELIYGRGSAFSPDTFDPALKHIEKIVNFYDYQACGISVLAVVAARGDARAAALVETLREAMVYYSEHIVGKDVGDRKSWNVPLRRLLLHLALAYPHLAKTLTAAQQTWYRDFVAQQVQLAIEHNSGFLPGVADLHLRHVNNHTAIFMQGLYYCGKVFGRQDWIDLTRDFAERYFASGHPDGYFEEHTNAEREGGPSLVYTRLTAGCLYDVLDGRQHPREKFVLAGDSFRAFLNARNEYIPIADERTNHSGTSTGYGLALHSLTPRGRYYIVDSLDGLDYSSLRPEGLAVLHHELDLVNPGDTEVPENRTDGCSRISLPLGIIRRNGFTAGLSALRALNHVLYPKGDYAIDQQNMVYLAHDRAGVILTGYKSKHDPEWSTFRIGADAYTVKTGELELSESSGRAKLYYETFTAQIEWRIGATAVLRLSSDDPRPITTALTITDEKFIRSQNKYEIKMLKGFSPYTLNNVAPPHKAAVFEWTRELTVAFEV